ncbi:MULTISPECIES: TonB-dependent receptor [unclassified Spirosoma]|uniref:TonB-dependent receptor n=1 Tax=unclassified Spirosoma TaxID=2621999 RepID=UPI000969475E|nr:MULTISPECIES: TonB-dependent receptor [unclassified Spirosoma]MBN8822777.1 TonB-dependent receptor [Spirosoma sp.]OJW79986.1 MAG: TonB-dependent receptor [Spirosoma sp. 48-14]
MEAKDSTLRYFLTATLLLWGAFLHTVSYAQSVGTITGRIITAQAQPLAHATVRLTNSRVGTTTNDQGEFVLERVPAGEQTIVISRIGHGRVRQTVNVVAGETTRLTDLTLLETAESLQEVTVEGKNSYKADIPSSSLRIKTPLIELPQNVQVINRQLIADQQIFDMLEGVSRNVSGVTRMEHWDNYARLNMRGSRVAPFRNGMNVESTWGPLAEDMSMVERIEFVKGPAGFMMANGEPSGFYNVVTKKPTGFTKGEFAMTTGSFDTYRATLDLDGKLSQDGNLLYRLNIMGQSKGSFRDFEYNNRYTIAPVLKYKLSDKTSITAEYTYQFSQMSVIGSAYVFSGTGLGVYPRNISLASANLDPTKINDHSSFLILEHQLSSNWKLTGQLAYFNSTQLGSSMWADSAKANGNIYRRVSIWDAANQGKFAQVFVNGDVTTGPVTHRILAGLDLGSKKYSADWGQSFPLYDKDFVFNANTSNYYLPTNLLPRFDRSQSLINRAGANVLSQSYSGLYVQDELRFLQDKVRLTLAGRITSTKDSQYGSGTDVTKATPRVGLSVSLNRQTSVYALYDQAFVPQAGADRQGNAFKPITGNNTEIGLKKDWAGGRWNSTISAYKITKNNVLTTDPTNPNFSIQLGQTQTSGVEFDIRGEIVSGLNLIANYAYTDSKITKDTEAKNVNLPVPGFSKHVTNAWLSYRVQKGAVQGLGLSLGYQWQLDRYGWFSDAVDKNPTLPNSFQADAAISWQTGPFNVALNVNNLFDAYIYSGAYYSWSNAYYWQAQAPRNFRLSLGYKF